MRETALRRRRTAVVAVAGLALCSVVVASATSLGGVSADDIGAASGRTDQLEDLSLVWTPVWHDDGWHLGELAVTTGEDRGFLAGDEVRISIGGSGCEVVTTLDTAGDSVTLDSEDMVQACGALPSLDEAQGVALSVTGDDDITRASDLGEIEGSVAGFAGGAIQDADAVTATTSSDGALQTVVVDVADLTAEDLAGASAVIVSGLGTATADEPAVAALDSGARVTIDVADLGWVLTAATRVDVALSIPQHLSAGISAAVGVVIGDGTATPSGKGPDAGNGGDGSTGEPGSGSGQTGDGLVPVAVSSGIDYSYHTPWTGAQTNQLTFCHQFTVTNTSGATLTDWTVTFDTDLPPMWGMDPTAGTVSLSNIATRDFDASTGYWTVGGANAWAQQIEAGGSRTVQFCATRVPTPAADPDTFDVTVSVVAQSDWYVTFTVVVTSDSPYYVPWQTEVDFADLVCGASLTQHPLTFQQVTATPVAGSNTAYVIEGTAGNTQLVSASHSRSFTFAAYSPGAGWTLPCGQA